jgi:glutamyl-tRNA synthetase
VDKFNLEISAVPPACFDPDKLDRPECRPHPGRIGGILAPRVLPIFKEKGYDAADDDYLAGVIETLHARSKTLVEMADGAHFYYAGRCPAIR